ncbi:MAG: transporter substrate-binding domain-containing protein, partial [Clostridiales bacterium]|nr:transporter substrate-binding domain-containing protein [Clostridiales bacterium]
FDASPYYVMVKKGNSALLEQVNYAIEQIGIDSPGLQSELFDKYYSAESGDDRAFTKSEREFIEAQAQSGTPLTAMIRPSKEPVSCYLNGEASGIIGELSNEIIRRTGLNVKFLQPADYREYEAIISASGADIVFDMHAVGNEAEMDGYKLTSSYMTLRYAQLSVDGSTSGKGRVAALENDKITSDYIKSAYPDSQITYYATLDECVDAVLSGRQDVYCTDVYSASFIVYNDVANRLSYTTFADSAASIAVGISDKADYRLVSVFNKTVQSLSDLYISSVINRRTNYPVPAFSLVRYFYAHPALSFFALTVFFAALMVVIISIARTRRRRERVRQNKEILRFVSYVCKANDVVIEFDIKMNKVCRYAVENGEVVRKNEESTVDDLLKTVHPDEASELEKIFRHENLKMMIENQQDVYI